MSDPAAGARANSGEIFLEYTKSICPVCKAVLDAEVNARDGKVFLRKTCRVHGAFEALVYSDAHSYVGNQRFNRPGTLPRKLSFPAGMLNFESTCGVCDSWGWVRDGGRDCKWSGSE